MNVIKSLRDLLFPENMTCELCGREVFDGARFCEDCIETVVFNDGTTCPKCGRRTKVPELCLDCKEQVPVFDVGVSAFSYTDGVKTLIHTFKKTRPYLKNYFADLLADKCRQFTDAEAVCYAPMTAAAQHRRGYNQAYLLAKELAARLKLPLIKKAIVKVKETEEQKTLSRRERESNLKSVFKADKELVAGKPLIVVDDVLTTGATADAICTELKKRGAVKLYFATVASVEYKGDI